MYLYLYLLIITYATYFPKIVTNRVTPFAKYTGNTWRMIEELYYIRFWNKLLTFDSVNGFRCRLYFYNQQDVRERTRSIFHNKNAI